METAVAIERESAGSEQIWSPAKQLAFRFCFAYFGLFSIAGLIGSVVIIPKVEIPDLGTLWPFRQIVFWVAAHLFGARLPLVYRGSGSGDKTWDWTEIFCILVVAVIATALWSFFDRGRENYGSLHKWFRISIRFLLGGTILLYAFDKLIPLQMSYPFLTKQIQAFSAFSPAGILWYSIGASPAYEIFAGFAELLGALLLMFPRTVTLGALVCVADLSQVFMLNMTYDVPVKLFSFHLLLLAWFLLAPEFERLLDFFVRNRSVSAATSEPLFRSAKANNIAAAVQVLLWLWIVGMNTYNSRKAWYEYGGARPKPPLYGIWDVTQMKMDGQLRPPLITDDGRWRRIIFDFPGGATAQHMNDSFESLNESIDMQRSSLTLSKQGDKKWNASFIFQHPAADQLILSGSLSGHPVEMQLKRVDERKFLLASRGFHWVQEYPVIR